MSPGAAKAIGLVLPRLKRKIRRLFPKSSNFNGFFDRTHMYFGQIYMVAEINQAMQDAANESFGYTEDPIVSSDIIGISYGSLSTVPKQRCKPLEKPSWSERLHSCEKQ